MINDIDDYVFYLSLSSQAKIMFTQIRKIKNMKVTEVLDRACISYSLWNVTAYTLY